MTRNEVYLCYNCVENDWWDGDGHCVTNVVTHWMPIVPPRKEDKI